MPRRPWNSAVIGAVQIDDEGTLQAAGGGHVGGVPRVAEADALKRLALRRDGPARPGELDAEEIPLARALTRLLRPRGRRRCLRRRPGPGAAWPGILPPRSRYGGSRPSVRPKRSVSAAFPFASPSSAAPASCTTGPARRIAEQTQGGRYGEGSSMHGVTSRGEGRGPAVGTAGVSRTVERLAIGPTTWPPIGRDAIRRLLSAPIVRCFGSGSQRSVREIRDPHEKRPSALVRSMMAPYFGGGSGLARPGRIPRACLERNCLTSNLLRYQAFGDDESPEATHRRIGPPGRRGPRDEGAR